MSSENPPSKDIDIYTQEGLELLKKKVKYYGYYAEQLKVLELIQDIEDLRETTPIYKEVAEQWMAEYDKLKEKYEPMVLLITD